MKILSASLFALFALFVLPVCVAFSANAETVRISGVGLSAPLMQRLADAYRLQQPGDDVSVVLPPLGSDGAMRALSAGSLELAIIARPLKPEEVPNYGRVRELGRVALGFATRDGQRAATLTARDIAAIYAGDMTHWDNGQPLRLIMRAERESDTRIVRTLSPEVNTAMEAALKRRGLVFAENDLEMARLLENTPGSFGPITVGLARLLGTSVRFLSLNGVLPTAKSVADGRYPLSKPLFVIEPLAPTAASQRFVAFLTSAAAFSVLTGAEFVTPR